MLWLRYVETARRVARRLTRVDADDLVSEAFLIVYDQVYVAKKGPRTAFRAYLFTVMRNTAARWYREGRALVLDPDVDTTFVDDELDRIERRQDDAVLVEAFRALPARWQRVLWLTEVEDVSRPSIASELGIRPNAVSALYRRARSGLREQWLLHQIPNDLRTDERHIAAALPAMIVKGRAGDREDADHLASCDRCRDAEAELRRAYTDGRKTAVSVGGLAALGVILPGATTIWAAPTSISIAAGAGFTLFGSAAALVGAVTLSLGIGVQLFPPLETASSAETPVPKPTAEASESAFAPRVPSTKIPAPKVPAPEVTIPPATPEPDSISFWYPTDQTPYEPPPAPPAPAEPGTVPEPADPGEDASSGAPQVQASQPASTFMAPVVSGTAAERESTMAIGVDEQVYTVTPDPEGTWAFDLRSLSLAAGAYTADVWSVTDGISSPATPVTFTIDTITVTSFEGDVQMDIDEASTEGVVFTVIGPTAGTICVASDTGQSVQLPAEADGTLTRRIRFLTAGVYPMSFAVCAEGYSGPSAGTTQWVSEGIFDPWDIDAVFEIEEVDPVEQPEDAEPTE